MPWQPIKGKSAHAKSADKEYDNTRRKFDPRLAEAKRIRSSSNWQKVRENKLSAEPLCYDPFGEHKQFNICVPAETVHHKYGLDFYPELAYVESNLCSLCNHCHARIEQMTRRGELDKVRKLWL